MGKLIRVASFFVLSVFLLSMITIKPAEVKSVGYAKAAPAEKMAVTPAGYDDIGDILTQLNFNADVIQESDLSDLAKLKQYEVVYINCSAGLDNYVTTAASVLNQYVKEGGVIYASDYANYLIQTAFPGKINFYGQGSDTTGSSARIGSAGKVTAKIVDSGLASILGKTSAEVNFDLGSWAVIDSAGSGTKVHVTGPVSIYDSGTGGYSQEYMDELSKLDYSNPKAIEDFYAKYQSGTSSSSSSTQEKPYVVSFSEGEGEVLYTSFHNEAQKTTDMEKLVNWFAVRTRASKLARATGALVSGDDVVLQEVVDTINQGGEKSYTFNATGEADFKVILNFGGSAIDISVTDSKGSSVAEQSVTTPPYTKEVDAKEGKYTIKLKGTEIPSANYPFVLTISGAQAAAADPIYESTSTSSDTGTTLEQGIKDKIISFLKKVALYAGIGFLGIIVLIVLIIVLVKRSHRKKNQTQPPATPPAQPPTTPPVAK
ncbi:hypothetical protein A2215_03790 [Candidatus Berkelbacteria bacterium RIFOXYA2_FULL_43_10]|uniref:Uncharacterized protein n=1 Tax=Candidatus Berkelbacteria bacterium RIFOXYA2_FULL_43_10 TaxID=1797472 RepID=A0A1F5E4J5_9BACT|nr:MAG: hypothetical protein A2215_03790 [Candidatus Berkelbacteria bacterium RIFOXYA2_FULL_43_10]